MCVYVYLFVCILCLCVCVHVYSLKEVLRGMDVAQVAKCLCIKHKVLSSNPMTAKNSDQNRLRKET
jgi:hypothetical protein